MFNKKMIIITFVVVVALAIISVFLFIFFSRPNMVVQAPPLANQTTNNVPSKQSELPNKNQPATPIDQAGLNNKDQVTKRDDKVIVDSFPVNLKIFVGNDYLSQRLLNELENSGLTNQVIYQTLNIENSSLYLEQAKESMVKCGLIKPIVELIPWLYDETKKECYIGYKTILETLKLRIIEN